MKASDKKREMAGKIAKSRKDDAKAWLEKKREGYMEHGDRAIAGPKRFLQNARKHAGMSAMAGGKGTKYARQDVKDIGKELKEYK